MPAARLSCLVVLFAGCAGPGGKDSDPTDVLECPTSLDTVCQYEFGTECPTYSDMAAMTCDGYHFDPTGSVGEAPRAVGGGKDCPMPSVTCFSASDSNIRTSFFFEAAGIAHPVVADLIWPSTDACPVDGVFGYWEC